MGWLPILMGVVATSLFGMKEHPIKFWLSILGTVMAFWSWGVMHNYALNVARARRGQLVENMRLEGRTDQEIAQVEMIPIRISTGDTQAAPNWATRINMIATALCVVMVIWAIVLLIQRF